MSDNPLQDLKNAMCKSLYDTTPSEAQRKGICVQCKEDAIKNCYSKAGVKEYFISGLCEKCFDDLFRESD